MSRSLLMQNKHGTYNRILELTIDIVHNKHEYSTQCITTCDKFTSYEK